MWDNPLPAFAAHLTDVLEANVYDAPASQLIAPAVVLRPDDPWISPSRFCHDEQRYVAIVVVSASTPGDGLKMLYQLAMSIMDGLPEGWRFESTSAPVLDETTGTAFLAASVRLLYANTAEAS